MTDEEWAILEPLIPAPSPAAAPPRWRGEKSASYASRDQRHPEGVPLKGKHVTSWKTASSGGLCPVTPQAYVPDLPHWSTVYHYFRKWQKEGVWEKAVRALARQDRERAGRYPSPSALVMDNQSVKTTEKGGPEETTGPKRSRGESTRS
ncbi:hypothetical protein TthSNM76_02120 [Thermus thermophilus]|nr:hypothetical protein TthSNM76_02120 [Thermus thermophilus]